MSLLRAGDLEDADPAGGEGDVRDGLAVEVGPGFGGAVEVPFGAGRAGGGEGGCGGDGGLLIVDEEDLGSIGAEEEVVVFVAEFALRRLDGEAARGGGT